MKKDFQDKKQKLTKAFEKARDHFKTYRKCAEYQELDARMAHLQKRSDQLYDDHIEPIDKEISVICKQMDKIYKKAEIALCRAERALRNLDKDNNEVCKTCGASKEYCTK